jgi:hypothetical protein
LLAKIDSKQYKPIQANTSQYKPIQANTMQVRIIKTNLDVIDLDSVYYQTEPEPGQIELLKMDGKQKYTGNKKPKGGIDYFRNCLLFEFNGYLIKICKNGVIQSTGMSHEQFDESLQLVFDALRVVGYDPEIVELRNIDMVNKKTIPQNVV